MPQGQAAEVSHQSTGPSSAPPAIVFAWSLESSNDFMPAHRTVKQVSAPPKKAFTVNEEIESAFTKLARIEAMEQCDEGQDDEPIVGRTPDQNLASTCSCRGLRQAQQRIGPLSMPTRARKCSSPRLPKQEGDESSGTGSEERATMLCEPHQWIAGLSPHDQLSRPF